MSEINTWPGWKCVRQIGAGSFGKVYEIERVDNGEVRKSALKVMSFPMSPSDVSLGYKEGWYSDEEGATTFFGSQIDTFSKEYELMNTIGRSDNIVSFQDYMVVPHEGWIGADILIRMELLTTFTQHRNTHPLTEKDIVKLGLDISKALEVCQNIKPPILHRDIKLDNIMVDAAGNYKLGDFGVARFLEGTKSAHTVAGTENYMAPEVIMGRSYTVTADIYSLGIVLYRLLNNNRNPFLPFDGPLTYIMQDEAKAKRLEGETPPPPQFGNERLKQIVLKCIAYKPEDRFQSAEELRKSLERLIEGKADNSLKKKNKAGIKVLIAAAVVALVGGGIFLANGNKTDKPKNQGGTVTASNENTDSKTANTATENSDSDSYVALDDEMIKIGNTTGAAYHKGIYSFRSDSSLEWSSSNESVASVDQDGIITAISEGTATIYAKYDGATSSAEITVFAEEAVNSSNTDSTLRKDKFDSVSILMPLDFIYAGDTVVPYVQADSIYYEGKVENAKWSVSDSSVLSVNENGEITAKKPGKSKVRLELGGAVDEQEIEVVTASSDKNIKIESEYGSYMTNSQGVTDIQLHITGDISDVVWYVYATDGLKFRFTWGEMDADNNVNLRAVEKFSMSDGEVVILGVDKNDNHKVYAEKHIKFKVL